MTEQKREAPGTRSIEIEQEIPAPPAEVWEALTTGEGLKNWFPADARVEPGVGGSIWLSWGPGMEAEAPITQWQPGRRMGWEERYGEDADGRPIKVAVDFHVEGREGVTVVRLVQSGLSADAQWDEMYDSLVDGWTYFLFNLAFAFAKHRGKSRRLLWRRVATDLGRDELWERLLAAAIVSAGADGTVASIELGDPARAEVVSVRPGHHYAATLPGLDDSLLFVEVEGKHVGFWLSTYGMDPARADELEAALGRKVDEATG